MSCRADDEAIPYFRAESLLGWDRSAALLGLACAHAALGQDEQAREYYSRFASLTSTGDDLPAIHEARDAIAR